MSLKKAQKIVNDVDAELGISLVAYQNCDLEFLKKKLTEFLALDIATEELEDADDFGLMNDDEEDYDDRDFGDDDDSKSECDESEEDY